MAKPTKVKYDDSDDDSCDNDSCRSDNDDENYSKDHLMDIIDQMSKGYKRLYKKSKIFEKELIAKSNENKALMEELEDLKKSKECKGLETRAQSS
jgi:hypothetical protein